MAGNQGGSPPLTRERHKVTNAYTAAKGITPAHAGKTLQYFSLQLSFRDHPRSRGKDIVSNLECFPLPGSPPLTRERQHRLLHTMLVQRITPAHAGKTLPLLPSSDTLRDHPRSRGKDFSLSRCFFGLPGSPPLTRERQEAWQQGIQDSGITPAHAGKTLRWPRTIDHRWDHPRSRGKDRHLPALENPKTGSPPLTRERRHTEFVPNEYTGITPAHAGKTTSKNLRSKSA